MRIPDTETKLISQLEKTEGGSRISGKGVHMYKGWGFALLILCHCS